MAENLLSESQEQVLRQQLIDDSHPGHLLHDFEVLLDYLGEGGVRASGKHGLLPVEALGELNQRLARPLLLDVGRPLLKSNPYLMGLHLLLRASGLGRSEGVGAGARLPLDPGLLDQWRRLNPTERYFNLLEAWLLYGSPEMVGERGGFWGRGFQTTVLQTWQRLPAEGTVVEDTSPARVFISGVGRDFYLLALMDLFGLVEVEHLKRAVSPWHPAAVRRLPFGDALCTLMVSEILSVLNPFHDQEEDGEGAAGPGMWQPIFQPYFPAWQQNLSLPGEEVKEGMFVFRVSLGPVWRLLAIPSTYTVDGLVSLILDSVSFDRDHLYELSCRGRFGTMLRIMHPACDNGPFGDEVAIGELPLAVGQGMDLHYDFGDDWRFKLKLERIDPPGRARKPRVLERHGKAPKQYPDYEDY